jgi:hypothetical protein
MAPNIRSNETPQHCNNEPATTKNPSPDTNITLDTAHASKNAVSALDANNRR